MGMAGLLMKLEKSQFRAEKVMKGEKLIWQSIFFVNLSFIFGAKIWLPCVPEVLFFICF